MPDESLNSEKIAATLKTMTSAFGKLTESIQTATSDLSSFSAGARPLLESIREKNKSLEQIVKRSRTPKPEVLFAEAIKSGTMEVIRRRGKPPIYRWLKNGTYMQL